MYAGCVAQRLRDRVDFLRLHAGASDHADGLRRFDQRDIALGGGARRFGDVRRLAFASLHILHQDLGHLDRFLRARTIKCLRRGVVVRGRRRGRDGDGVRAARLKRQSRALQQLVERLFGRQLPRDRRGLQIPHAVGLIQHLHMRLFRKGIQRCG